MASPNNLRKRRMLQLEICDLEDRKSELKRQISHVDTLIMAKRDQTNQLFRETIASELAGMDGANEVVVEQAVKPPLKIEVCYLDLGRGPGHSDVTIHARHLFRNNTLCNVSTHRAGWTVLTNPAVPPVDCPDCKRQLAILEREQ